MIRTAGKSSFFRRRAPADLFGAVRPGFLSRQLSAIMKTTGRATRPSRVSGPPVPLEPFLIVTKPVVGESTAIISIELLLAYNNHGASPTYPLRTLLPYIARGRWSSNHAPRQAIRRAITKYPPCRRWRLLRPRGRCGNRSDCTGHRQQPLKHANT